MAKRTQVRGLSFSIRKTFMRMLRPGTSGTRGTWRKENTSCLSSNIKDLHLNKRQLNHYHPMAIEPMAY